MSVDASSIVTRDDEGRISGVIRERVVKVVGLVDGVAQTATYQRVPVGLSAGDILELVASSASRQRQGRRELRDYNVTVALRSEEAARVEVTTSWLSPAVWQRLRREVANAARARR